MEENGDITEDYLQGLVTNKVAENRTIEYKASLPDGTDASKKEFLSDVSAFANANGGRILYGIEEGKGQLKGVPVEISGLPEGTAIDKTILRLESMLRDGVAPRIFGVRVYDVLLGNGKYVIAIQIPKSWNGPHMVTFDKHSRFYLRGNAGKSLMDVHELRDAFAQTDALPEKARRFRDERLARILNGETPVPLGSGAAFTLHIIPQSAFSFRGGIDVRALLGHQSGFAPIDGSGYCYRFNADGYVIFSSDGGTASSYCQVFRSGAVEAVCLSLCNHVAAGGAIRGCEYERCIIDGITRYMAELETLAVSYPFIILHSAIRIRGYRMAAGPRYCPSKESIDRDVLTFPGLLLSEPPDSFHVALQPTFDAVWNACGWPRSPSYDENGHWNPK